MEKVTYTKEILNHKQYKWQNMNQATAGTSNHQVSLNLDADETEVKKLLSDSRDTSPEISPQSAPHNVVVNPRYFEFPPDRGTRHTNRTRSMSDEPQATSGDVPFNAYIPTSTRSMIIPTLNSSGRNMHATPTTHLSSGPPSRAPSFGSNGRESHHSHSFAEFKQGMLSRSSTRRSFGKEWTSKHWNRVKNMEHESERAKRCSKLSSGFAPLMVFGGLVFLCIGISAATNNGKEKDKLQSLSTTPMVMGVIMLILGAILIFAWAACRKKSKMMEKHLLHGSRRNSEIDGNIIQNILAKLSSPTGGRRAPSPKLPGVTLDGIDILKSQSDSELRASNIAQRQLYLYNHRNNNTENNRSNQFITCTDVVTV